MIGDLQFHGNIVAILAFAVGIAIGGLCVDFVRGTPKVATWNAERNYALAMGTNGMNACKVPPVPMGTTFFNPDGQ